MFLQASVCPRGGVPGPGRDIRSWGVVPGPRGVSAPGGCLLQGGPGPGGAWSQGVPGPMGGWYPSMH